MLLALSLLAQAANVVLNSAVLNAAGYERMKEFVCQNGWGLKDSTVFFHLLQKLYSVGHSFFLSRGFGLFFCLPAFLALAAFLLALFWFRASQKGRVFPLVVAEGLFAGSSFIVLGSVYVQKPLLPLFLLWVQLTCGAAWGVYLLLASAILLFLWRERGGRAST